MIAGDRFALADDPIALPRGAWASTERRMLRIDGKPLLALTQGRQARLRLPALYAERVRRDLRGAGRPPPPQFLLDRLGPCALHDAGGRRPVRGVHLQLLCQRRLPGARARPHRHDRRHRRADRRRQLSAWPSRWSGGGRSSGRRRTAASRRPRRERSTSKPPLGTTSSTSTSRLAAAEWDLHVGPTRPFLLQRPRRRVRSQRPPAAG